MMLDKSLMDITTIATLITLPDFSTVMRIIPYFLYIANNNGSLRRKGNNIQEPLTIFPSHNSIGFLNKLSNFHLLRSSANISDAGESRRKRRPQEPDKQQTKIGHFEGIF